nr:MAG TPA: hypothetical protein [Caudoviricetes sp.]
MPALTTETPARAFSKRRKNLRARIFPLPPWGRGRGGVCPHTSGVDKPLPKIPNQSNRRRRRARGQWRHEPHRHLQNRPAHRQPRQRP